MYHQFKQLADIDITKEPMEVGPTTHYIMGGVRVDGDTQMSTVPGPVRRGRMSRPGCTAPTGWAAIRSPTCWCSASAPASTPPSSPRTSAPAAINEAEVDARGREALAPFEREPAARARTRSSTTCRTMMQDLVGIVRTRERDAAGAGEDRRARGSAPRRSASPGNREYNPGWHTALDLKNLLTVSEAITRAALERKESRGGQFRDDYPGEGRRRSPSSTSCVRKGADGEMQLRREPIPPMPAELQAGHRGDEVHGRQATFRIWRGDARRRRVPGLHDRGRPRAWWCSTPSTRSRPTQAQRPRLPLELQGRQVRLVLGRDQRHAAS